VKDSLTLRLLVRGTLPKASMTVFQSAFCYRQIRSPQVTVDIDRDKASGWA